ncbi:MAG: division/cell wall cluster transcriptional repressor MraZ [Ilumatobacteraceae bacterium]
MPSVTLDGQGRVTLPPDLRDFAGLAVESKVVVAGSFDRVEVWNLDTYERQLNEGGALIRGAN